MIKITRFACLLVLCVFNFLNAKQVKPEDAQKVAENFLQKSQAFMGQTPTVTLSYINHGQSVAGVDRNYFFVYNINTNGGFIIVSADDVAWPVLGYATSGMAQANDIPWSVAKWLEGYRSDIQVAIEQNTPQAEMCKLEWQKWLNPAAHTINIRAGSVSPLMATKWNQSPYFNAQCPYDNSAGQRTVVGCVATAMAQVIKYHGYPTQGTGFHSYNHSTYGTLSANFASTTYDYASMPNTVNSTNTPVATLSYHCGVSVDMNYGVASTGGSGAYVIKTQSPVTHCAEYALETYFGYKSSLSGIERANYTTSSWKSTLKAELDAARPILYAGFGNGGGHCFVLDGYDNSDYFHINWGWGGSYDGYFSIDALNPTGVGTGGGSGGFNSGHQAVIGIEPPSGGGNPAKFDMVLYKDLTLSATKIGFGAAISVTTNVYNRGTSSFSGDYGMAVFDDNNNFVDFIATKTGMSLTNGYVYSNDLVFSTTGNVKFLPGNYTTILYYRPTGGDWSAVGDYNSHYNSENFSVVYSNDIELYSNITLNSGNTIITREKSITVNLDIANYGSTTMNGDINVSLYDLEGKFVESINQQTFSLQSMKHYTNGLNFTLSTGVVADAGTYLLAVLYRPTSGNWILVGSTNYQNPIKVTVQDPPVVADIYESNNTAGSAYSLSASYSSNKAKITTTGSNLHIGTDYDYYKVVLPAGYNYSIMARLHDAENSGDGNVYTVDAVLSVSSDGSIFSEAYDYTLPSNMAINNGGVFYVKVSPYFTGNVGNYLLEINITRTAIVNGINSANASAVKLYPNPSADYFKIETNSAIQGVEILAMDGRQVASITASGNENTLPVQIPDLAVGKYLVRITTKEGVLVQTILIQK